MTSTPIRLRQEYLLSLLEKTQYGEGIVLFNGTNSDARAQAVYADWIKRHQGTDKITGSRTADTRAALVEHFKERGTVMIATEAGAEGTERRFAVILERDALNWLKPAKGQFQIYYKLGSEQPEYIPDFVAETGSMILMVETKKRDDLSSDEVKSKAVAAVRWCSHASSHAATVGGKPWRYLLVPHDEIKELDRLTDFLRFEVKT